MKEIDIKILKDNFLYDEKTGIFTWVTGNYKGKIAGSPQSEGYIYMMYKGHRFYAHRAAIAYVTGKWPNGYIDHINFDTSDNRIENLRVVTFNQNMHHRRLTKTGKSGLRGVKITKYNTYEANIKINGKNKYLGSYKDKYEAYEAYKAAAIEIFGDSATFE